VYDNLLLKRTPANKKMKEKKKILWWHLIIIQYVPT